MNKDTVSLTLASLLSIILFTFHLADDIARGFENGQLGNLVALPVLVLWLYGAVMLTGRLSGYIITLLGSMLGLLVPYIHMSGKGVGLGSRIGNTSGALFFVWTLLALGLTALFSLVLSVRGLWYLRRNRLKVRHADAVTA